MPEFSGNTVLEVQPSAKMVVDRVFEGHSTMSLQPAAEMTYVPIRTWPIPEPAFSLIHWCANNLGDLITILGELPGQLRDALLIRAWRSGGREYHGSR